MAVICAVITSGCGPVKSKVEEGIEKALPDIVGPAKSYDVEVSGSALKMIKGKLRTMHITGEDVKLSSGILLSKLTVDSENIAFDTDKNELKRAENTKFTAILSEDVLNNYLTKKYPSVPDLKIELQKDKIRILANPGAIGLKVRIVADAKLKVQDSRLIVLDFQKATVAGIATPGFAKEYVESKINPIFDASALGYDAKIESVSLQKGELTLNGDLDLMAAAKNRKFGGK